MTELVFCESLAGALKMAKGMRPGTVQRGVRCVLHEDGACTSEEYRQVWQAPGVPGTPGQVACLALGLSMGALSGLPGLAAREAHFARCWQAYGRGLNAQAAAHESVCTARRAMDALAAEAAQTQGYVRLWLGPSPDEACGFLFACSLLAHAVCRVGVVVLGGLHPGPQGTLVQLAAGGELAPEALGAFLPQEKPLGAPQLGALSGMWAALKAEDAPLRALVNGRLMGVPEHFYDPWLLRAIPRTGSFQAAVAIGRALAAVPGVGDAVFVQRLQALLAAARRMAGGDLATPVEGDMGLFDPLKDELNQVRAGFEKAVAAEVRSQNMKTELITNVSHDLKTPLTAIITYVDLLKDPALSAEDRAKYIETLDKKSQRLKRLIEDLFEVSKAATRNVAMHYAEVDLAALLKQVQYELADKTEASGIDFRWQLPEERMPLVLDGQKTCRIFENLVVNITKYGMPGTRAYITLMPQEHGAQVVFKNISATELDFSAEEITDRFVRGDRSRNTEGSGLGLAIAKSFAELQGGTFSITVDGDLFKATVTLPDTNQPEQPETLPLPAAPDADAQSAPQTGGALPAGI